MKINIQHMAKLANLSLTKEEEEKFEKQLESTLEHVERLKNIDTSHVSGTNEVTNLKNVTRDDQPVQSLTQEEAIKNAKTTHNGFFVVKAILGE